MYRLVWDNRLYIYVWSRYQLKLMHHISIPPPPPFFKIWYCSHHSLILDGKFKKWFWFLVIYACFMIDCLCVYYDLQFIIKKEKRLAWVYAFYQFPSLLWFHIKWNIVCHNAIELICVSVIEYVMQFPWEAYAICGHEDYLTSATAFVSWFFLQCWHAEKS